jgi:hypothetical protein
MTKRSLTLVEGCDDGASETDGTKLGFVEGIAEKLGVILGVVDG